ncbi:hypothetical protein [Methylorubrum sp. POS3]|uniref:hypothetical protein n=1 Tax=Methylorubrum sp. POS3 TaxID=2998492 RepID=UPI0037279909
MAQRNPFNLFGGGNSPAASVGKVAVGAMLVTGTVPAGATAVCRKKVGSTVTTLGAATVTATGAASYTLSAAAAGGESYGFAWTLPGESVFTAVIVGLGPAATKFTAGASAGSLVAAITGLDAGVTAKSIAPNDGRLTLNAAGNAILVGLTASSVGTKAYTVTLSTGETFNITVTVEAPAAGDPNRYMFAATRLRFPSTTGTLSGSGTVYSVQSFFIGTPDYAVSNPRFFLPTFYGVTTGANPSEFALPTAYQYEKLAIKVGGTWYECPNAAFMVDPAVDASGFLLDAIPVTMPANTVIECRMAWNAPGGSTLAGVSRANDIAEISMLSSSGSLAAKCTDGTALTANGFARHVIPAFMVAKGWDGRPVGLLAGDSIQAGANENSITGFMSPRGTQGYWQRGLDDNTNSQRIAFGTLALEGARPSDWSTRANWSRKLDAVAKVTAVNSNKPPMTFIGSNHGNNSASIANPYSWLTGFWQVLKTEWPGVPIYHSELLARPVSSSDGWQSLAGQNVQASDAYNGGTSPGIRWTANEIIGKGAANGDPTAQARSEGWIQGSFAAWRPGSYDTGANRDKLAIVPFDTTITVDSAANNLTVTLASVTGISLGEMLIVNPGGTGSYDAIVKTINGNVVTLSGSSSTAMAAGTRVTAALNDRTGLHPGTKHHIKIAMEAVVPWKQFMGWVNAVVDPAPLNLANLPSAIRSALPGSNLYEGGAYANGRLVGRTSTNALKDAATATLPTGWQRDTTNKWINLTSSIPSDQTTISDWLLQDDWTFRIPASGGTPLNLTFSQNVIKPAKSKICAIDNRQNGSYTLINNDIGGSIQDAAGCAQTFVMHPGGTGSHTYKDNAFWNMPEDHIRLSEGGGTVQGNFFFGGGQSQLEDPHFDCIQVLPNVVPRTLKGSIVVKDNYFDMRRGVGHVQAVRLADIAAIDAGVTITITGNVFVDPNYDISFPGQNTAIVINGNYFAAQNFPSNQKNGAADYGEYLAPIPSQAVIYDNYRMETGAKLALEQNRPA